MSLPSVRPGRLQPFVLVSALLIAAVYIALYGLFNYSAGYNEARMPVLVYAESQWRHIDDWQFCYFVPFIVGAIIYFDRVKLKNLPIDSTWSGLPIILVAAFFYWFGYEADIIYFGYMSCQLMVAGLIIYFLGWRWMMALSFAWLFMAFMWPLLFLSEQVSPHLRAIMSRASVMVLNIVGIPTMLMGTAVVSGPDALTHRPMGALFQIDVADACSGMRSLFALTMVSAVWGYFTVEGPVRKWIIFLSSIPLAMLGNLCRIIMLTFGTIALGAPIAIGTEEHPSFFHMLAGYIVFAVALIGLMVVTKLVNLDWSQVISRLRPPPGPRRAIPPPPGAGGTPNRVQDVY